MSTTNGSFTHSPPWRWDWDSLCGAGGLNIWSPTSRDLGLCFQQLCLQIPILSILAFTSAYYFGKNGKPVIRGAVQILAINFRCFMVLIMASLPVLQIYIDLYKSENRILKISYFLCAVQGIAWITHFFFCLSLRKFFGKSPRGPVLIRVIWTSIFVMTLISLRSHFLIYDHAEKPDFSVFLSYTFSVIHFLLQVMYALSLFPGKGDTVSLTYEDRPISAQPDENSPLLSHSYVSLINENGDYSYLGVAMENSSWLSKLLFSWANPLMEKGDNEMLQDSEDLFDLPGDMHVGHISDEMEKHVSPRKETYPTNDADGDVHTPEVIVVRGSNSTLLKALHKCFWKEFYGIGILRFMSDCAGFAGPMLLNRLVSFIEDKNEPIHWGYLYAAGLASSAIVGALCDSHFQFWMSVIGLKMRTALVTTIYRKVLAVNGSVLNSYFSVGEIVNFMSTDTDRIVNSCPSFHAVWSIPFQLGVTLYLLYTQVGLAFLAGVVFSVALIPINKLIANKIGQLSTKLMAEKDSRVRVITEVLRGIKAVKLYVWEQHFIRSIKGLRKRELKYLKGRKYLDALCVYFWATTPVLISILTFGTYVQMGNKLTAATVFTGIALLNMLISPLNAFPWVLNGLTEAWVSMKRIQKLLNLTEVDLKDFYDEKIMEENRHCDIVLQSGSFNWGKSLTSEEIDQLHSKAERKSLKGKGRGKGKLSESSEEQPEVEPRLFELHDISIKIKKGEFIGVMGTVGCGKSSFLSAILGELNMTEGDIAISQVDGGFGFVSQQPWLQRGTIRDNILFGKTFDEQRYKSVLFACGLADDIYSLPAADLTGIGDSGTTLSGGQKARIALARAVYQDKSVYLLDDVLSAVDVKVARHIFQHCIMKMLKDKTRILCTHLVDYLVYADRIILMENGAVKLQGKSMHVLRNFDSNLPLDLELSDDSQSTSTLENSLLSSVRMESKSEDTDSVLLNERSQRGSLEFGVLRSYLAAVGWLLVLAILLSIVLMQTSRNMTDLWLSQWVTATHSENNSTNYSGNLLMYQVYLSEEPNFATIDFYLKVYVALAVFNSVFTLLRAFLFAYGGIVAARRIHQMLLVSVMRAQSTFFDVSPVGRILNRFSSDTYTIDDSLPFIMNILLAQFFGLMGTVIITIYGLPWICLILFPLVPVYHWLQYSYRRTSRELKRISSSTMSPLYSHFNETLQGLSTIRAMRASRRFKKGNEENLEENIKAQFSSQAAARWLGLRLQFIGVAMVTGVSFIAVIQHHYDVADPGLIGLAVSYALSVTGSLGGVINAFTETEREMIAVERVNQYVTQVPPETTHHSCEPPFGWPNQGVIHFDKVVLRYRENLPPSLSGVSFETRPCEKIGVVGRTGAGKSSLIAGLFRMVEVNSGSIFIDTVRIRDVSLSSLRSRLFCIPQEPFLFSGTLRDNLDPLGEFRDNEIWSALGKVNLVDTIKTLGGLENDVGSGGMNFSMGQKQLVCLARAVLHNAKILCIDEATANVDHETDRLIQLTLRTAFRQSTVLTIAHRVETILDSDRVLVMGDGRVLEFDTPDSLLADTNSHFYQMVNHE
ncbi:ATP-binding cassette sub-family C member 10 [Coccinella septempunctata]|uniref:ATP-binding cassette sub-family C member 10 n=1 Tax=Coccinella septempunctata TaxID=41139 RepID=UPI001D05EE61|nr:ATP-binding cassette sub-family C member 10 [Coccinella septempunctata]